MLRKALATFGEYLIFLRQVFSKPAKWSIFLKKWLFEMDAMGIGSMLIVCIVSLAMGSVITLQTALQIESSCRSIYFNLMFSSSNCFVSIGVGAGSIVSRPALFFGNAMKSRMLSQSLNTAHRRSKPKAMPP